MLPGAILGLNQHSKEWDIRWKNKSLTLVFRVTKKIFLFHFVAAFRPRQAEIKLGWLWIFSGSFISPFQTLIKRQLLHLIILSLLFLSFYFSLWLKKCLSFCWRTQVRKKKKAANVAGFPEAALHFDILGTNSWELMARYGQRVVLVS